jgi:hypothetical protein
VRSEAYDEGFRDGFTAGREGMASHSANGDTRTLKRAVTLTHPDRHPAERQHEANEVPAELLTLINTKPRIETRSLSEPMNTMSR